MHKVEIVKEGQGKQQRFWSVRLNDRHIYRFDDESSAVVTAENIQKALNNVKESK